ncbi:MAG: Mut7-C ubiquitin/RNAse domain-containing protein [Chloroflexi bacterium]|nr:Mut7-C ubiquitin/RNAse domain-containing protein [Chloroflexota bacterium]
MSQARFQFHGELNDFLPRGKRFTTIDYPFNWRASIKDMIESHGIPHCEVDVIVVNGHCVDFGYLVCDADQIQVYPSMASAPLHPTLRLRPLYPGRPRFILDIHLGRLAAYLRMIGFDSLWRNDYEDPELARVAHDEQRILLSRDIGLLKRSLVTYGYFVRHIYPRERIREIIQRFDLSRHMEPFKHCMKCNGMLRPVAKPSLVARLPQEIFHLYDDFHICTSCERIYWKGSHYRRMVGLIEELAAV